MNNGVFSSGWGAHKYTYDDILEILADQLG